MYVNATQLYQIAVIKTFQCICLIHLFHVVENYAIKCVIISLICILKKFQPEFTPGAIMQNRFLDFDVD